MEKNRFIIGLIIILLVTTVYSIYNTNDLKSKVDRLNSQINTQESRLLSQIYGIENLVNEIAKDNEWYEEPIRPQILFEDEIPKLKLEFKLKEFEKDSKVTFHIKDFYSEAFETYDVSENGTGIYAYEITNIDTISPIIDFEINPISTGNLSFETGGKAPYATTLAYFISVENGDQVRVSDTYYVYMDELSYPFFQPIGGAIDVDVENGLIHTLLDSNVYNPNEMYYAIYKITVQAYKDLKLVQFWTLPEEREEGQFIHYRDTLEITEDYDSLFVEVSYVGIDSVHRVVHRKRIGGID